MLRQQWVQLNKKSLVMEKMLRENIKILRMLKIRVNQRMMREMLTKKLIKKNKIETLPKLNRKRMRLKLIWLQLKPLVKPKRKKLTRKKKKNWMMRRNNWNKIAKTKIHQQVKSGLKNKNN